MRAPDAPGDTESGGAHQLVDWAGGTLDELIALLSGPAWSARVEVLAGAGGNPVGEVHVIAGGVSDAIFEGKSTHDALDRLRAVKGPRFRIEPRLPNPSDGDLTFPGPDQGKLEERPLAHLMRYCEDYVLTAGIEVWRGSENAKVDYRRGDIAGVTVGGIDAPERLAEVMKWSSGSYRLLVPRLTLPETAPKIVAPAPVAAPRSAGATNKTIFGMPALDPVALAAATDKARAGLTPGPAKATEMAAASGVSNASSAAMAAPFAPAGGSPGVSGSVAAGGPQVPAPATPRHSDALAKTIFGVQAPSLMPAGDGGATPAETGGARATQAPTTGAKPVPAAAETAKPSKAKAGAPGSVASSRASAAPTSPTMVVESERTSPSKAAMSKPGETPVWTYVGVGFVFGLALLGVYRLVIVLAH